MFAVADAGVTTGAGEVPPSVHTRETVTAGPTAMPLYTLLTLTVALFKVLVIEHPPRLNSALHVPSGVPLPV